VYGGAWACPSPATCEAGQGTMAPLRTTARVKPRATTLPRKLRPTRAETLPAMQTGAISERSASSLVAANGSVAKPRLHQDWTMSESKLVTRRQLLRNTVLFTAAAAGMAVVTAGCKGAPKELHCDDTLGLPPFDIQTGRRSSTSTPRPIRRRTVWGAPSTFPRRTTRTAARAKCSRVGEPERVLQRVVDQDGRRSVVKSERRISKASRRRTWRERGRIDSLLDRLELVAISVPTARWHTTPW